jgi:hypothetical protein
VHESIEAMGDEDRAELALLRARAYGPDADIADDAAARARLEELESLLRTPPVPEEPAAPAAPEPAPAPEPTPTPETASEPAKPPRSRRLLPVAWIASVVAVAALAVGATYAATATAFSLVPRDPGMPQVAVIEIDHVPSEDSFLGYPSDVVYFQDFAGVTAVSTVALSMTGDLCLAIMWTDDVDTGSDGLGSIQYYACGAGTFPATVPMVVTVDFPAELRERYPIGTALQFVLDDDRVGVFVDTSTPSRAPSED